MQISPYVLLLSGIISAGVGFTLLNYSRDGDLENRSKKKSMYSKPNETSNDEAWDRLVLLSNAGVMEVTWNTTLFVAFVSSLVFLSLIEFAKTNNSATITGVTWLMSLFTVFALQDGVIRWKNAHRNHASVYEKLSIIERLRWQNYPSLEEHSTIKQT
jgi:hypothetical protein